MKRLQSLIPILGIAAASLFGVVSCGDNSVACGDGTHAEDGLCVPDATCGPGTKEDPGTGKCVPDGSVVCPQGTTFTDGVCALDDAACGEGTVLVDGECILEDDNIEADLEEAAEPNDDPATPAGMLTVGAVDSSTVIHGCINPRSDEDGDGNLDADFDLWFINATGPTTLEITADGVHGLVAGFAVVNGDPLLASTLSNWRRFGINLTSDTAQRQVYLPAAGTYALQMTDARSLFLGSGAAGSETACYYTTIKHIATPAATALTLPSTAAQDRGQVKLFTFNPATAGRILDITQNTESGAMFPAFLVLRGAANNLYASVRDAGGFYTVGGLNMGETVTLVSDMEYNYALTPQDYSYDLFDITGQALPANGTVTLTKRNGATPAAPYADLNYLYFDVAAAGQILNFNVVANTTATPPVALPVDMLIVKRDIFTPAGAFDAVASIDAIGGTGRTGGFANQFVRFAQPGRYYFIVQDPLGTSGQTYTITSSFAVTPTTPVTVGTPLAAQALPANNNAFHTLDLTTPIWLQFGVTGVNFPAGTATARLSFYDLAGSGWMGGNYLAAFTNTQNADGSAPFGRVMARDTKDYIVRVEPVGTAAANPTYALDIKNRDHFNFNTIVSGTPIMRTGMDDVPAATSATAFGVKRFIVFGTAGNSLVAGVTPINALADISIRRVNVDETTATTVNTGLVGVAETLSTAFVSAPNDWVAFEVQNRTLAVTTNLTLNLNSVMPRPYVSTAGAIAFSDACVGAGSTTIATDQDDEYQARRALPAGWTFSLFGEPVTNYIIASNGFIKMGDAAVANPTCSFGCFSNQAIPLVGTDGANGIVAPLWNDYDTMTICEKVEATKVTIQWTGNEYNATPTAQFQVIFNMNGVINFVYGSGATHNTTGASATIGLENLGGTFGHQYSFNTAVVTAGTSRVMTPAP